MDEDGVIEAELVDESAPAPPSTPRAAAPTTTAPTAPAAEPSPSQAPPRAASAPVQQTRAASGAAASGFAIPGGRSKGTPLEDADDKDLSYWGGRLEQELADGTGKVQFRDRNEALSRAIRAEQGRRAGGDQEEEDGGSSGDFEAGDDDDVPF